MRQPCPACPDGNEWGATGPTGRACATCGGNAYLPLQAPVNACGPAGTTGCACVSTDASICSVRRYGEESPGSEPCTCLCHEWDDEE